jgi:pilus assembly protein Flp/PilA
MTEMNRHILGFWKNTRAQDLVEYALAAGMMAVAGVAALPVLTTTVSHAFSKIASFVTSVMG